MIVEKPLVQPFTGKPALRSSVYPLLRARMRAGRLELARSVGLAERLEEKARTFSARLSRRVE